MADAETNRIDFYISLSPVAQTAIWAGVAVTALVILREPVKQFAKTVVSRVSSGDNLTTPWLTLERRAELEKLDKAEITKPELIEDAGAKEIDETEEPTTTKQWNRYRQGTYEAQRGLFLVHVISPSDKTGQTYEIFILVKRHKDRPIDDIEKVDFYLGQYWGNKVFSEVPRDGLVGLRTSAYGPFLCVCKVHLKAEGSKPSQTIMLERYIDFEMGKRR